MEIISGSVASRLGVLMLATWAALGGSFTQASTEGRTARSIRFSGATWTVKDAANPVGPGPNRFGNSSKNVRVDADGNLHLAITRNAKAWSCAEIVCTKSLGYGTYTFRVRNTDVLDHNVILGLFTWCTKDPAYSNREMDVEISRWGRPDNENCQFVVQPYDSPGRILRFDVPKGLAAVDYSFTWKPDSVSFVCKSSKSKPDSEPIRKWEFTGADIPRAGCEQPRINLWLLNRQPPANGKPAEVVVESFEFTPPERG